MFLERYELKAGESFASFEFVSAGPKGEILKVITFTPTDYENVYNLGFGDKLSETEDIDDMSVSDNGDTEKILSTVAFAVYTFTNQHSQYWIYATGSTHARNRLYRMGISKYLIALQTDYEILGETSEEWEAFKKGSNYSAFLFKKKSL